MKPHCHLASKEKVSHWQANKEEPIEWREINVIAKKIIFIQYDQIGNHLILSKAPTLHPLDKTEL